MNQLNRTHEQNIQGRHTNIKVQERKISQLEETLMMDHSETLRREKVEYQNKIANIRQRTS